MIASLWDLKRTTTNHLKCDVCYHDSFPMGFETHALPFHSKVNYTIMIASLWDLKQDWTRRVEDNLGYHDSFPMGFETVSQVCQVCQ